MDHHCARCNHRQRYGPRSHPPRRRPAVPAASARLLQQTRTRWRHRFRRPPLLLASRHHPLGQRQQPVLRRSNRPACRLPVSVRRLIESRNHRPLRKLQRFRRAAGSNQKLHAQRRLLSDLHLQISQLQTARRLSLRSSSSSKSVDEVKIRGLGISSATFRTVFDPEYKTEESPQPLLSGREACFESHVRPAPFLSRIPPCYTAPSHENHKIAQPDPSSPGNRRRRPNPAIGPATRSQAALQIPGGNDPGPRRRSPSNRDPHTARPKSPAAHPLPPNALRGSRDRKSTRLNSSHS